MRLFLYYIHLVNILIKEVNDNYFFVIMHRILTIYEKINNTNHSHFYTFYVYLICCKRAAVRRVSHPA
jgi:hypothetical protein